MSHLKKKSTKSSAEWHFRTGRLDIYNTIHVVFFLFSFVFLLFFLSFSHRNKVVNVFCVIQSLGAAYNHQTQEVLRLHPNMLD